MEEGRICKKHSIGKEFKCNQWICKSCKKEHDKKYAQNHKEEKQKYDKIYNEKNKEKRYKQKKEYKEKNLEKNKQYQKEYRLKNKDKQKNYIKKYRLENSKKLKENVKKYYENNKIKLIEKQRDYYENNKEIISKRGKIYRKNNKDKLKKRRKDYRERTKDIKKIKDKEYRIKNRDKLNKRKQEYSKKRKLEDPLYKLKISIRSIIANALKNNKCIKKSRTYEILGCSYDEFKIHIEKQFKEWMNWNNKGNWKGIPKEINTAWDLDHIIPLDTAKCEKDIIKLNHYTNLRPLCSYSNRWIKRNKVIY